MPSPPRVVVITGFYNRRAVVSRTMDSLAGQSYRNLEIIAFDDASTDGTGDALEEACERIPNARFIRNARNRGFAESLIATIGESESDFIAIHGSGDVAHPERIRLQADALQSRPEVSVVGCYYRNIIEDSGLVRPRRISANEATIASLYKQNVFSHGEVMYRREAYRTAGGYRREFRYALDFDLWLRMRRLGPFFTVPEFLYDRYVLRDGVSYEPSKFLLQCQYIVAAKLLSEVRDLASADSLLSMLRSNGPRTAVASRPDQVDAELLRGAIRSAIWGYGDESKAISRMIQATHWRLAATLLRFAWGLVSATPLAPAVYATLGIETHQKR